MPLHQDDPDRDGNLSDEEYNERVLQMKEEFGDDGLHIIPGLSDQDE